MTTQTTIRDIDRLTGLSRRLTGDEKHAPSAHSTLDVLWVLYDRVLRITPESVDAPDRDRFLLSKGHGSAAYYAVLAAKGFILESWLADLAGPAGPLGHHPDRLLGLGVGRADLHRYGSPTDHVRWHGLDAAGLGRSIRAFLG